MKKLATCLLFILFIFSFGILEVHAEEAVVGGKNNFQTAKPVYKKNARVTYNKISSWDGNNPFYVNYEFDLSKYKQAINAGKFKMDFSTSSESWYQKHVKEYIYQKGKKMGYERPVLTVYTTDYNNQKKILINKSNSGESNNGRNYSLNITIPANTKMITFVFNSEYGGNYGTTGFGCDYTNMNLTFYDFTDRQNKIVTGEKNNFEDAKPTYQKNANITSNKISSKDGNNPFQVAYEFDLSEYKKIINEGKFEVEFRSGSDSWYQKHVKEYIYQDGKRMGYERPTLTIYTTDYNNQVKNLINKSNSGESNRGKNYNLNMKIPTNTKTITFEFNSECGGDYKGEGFGAYYKDMELYFIDDLSKVNLFKYEYGNFNTLKNVKNKELKRSGYNKLKDTLSDFGVPDKFVDTIMTKAVGIDDGDIGKGIAEYASGFVPSPYVPSVFVDKLADAINGAINNDDFDKIDLTLLPIEPQNRVDSFKAYYDIPVKADSPFLGTSTFKLKNELSGNFRDNIETSISYFTTDGVEHKINKNSIKHSKYGKYDLNEFTIKDILYGKTDFIRIKYENKFKKPDDLSKVIADGIHKYVNDLCKPFNPISNKAKDDIAKILKEIGIDDFYANGDVGKIVGEKLVGKIPGVGSVVKFLGGDEAIADIVRDILNTKNVISDAKISNSRLLLLNSQALADNDNNKSNIDVEQPKEKKSKISCDFSFNPGMKIVDGSFSFNRAYEHSLYASPSGDNDALMIFDGSNFKDGEIETKITIYDPAAGKCNDAGIVFRVNNASSGRDNYNGYYAGIRPNMNGKKGQVMIGYHNSGTWKRLGTYETDIKSRTSYDLKIEANGSEINVYLDGEMVLSVTDETYSEGDIGFRALNIPAIYQNIEVLEYVKEK